MTNLLHPAIVVRAFNRPASLERLLESLKQADYPDAVKLVISIDGGAPEVVRQIADNFSHSLIDTEVIQHDQPLGLRNHALFCGDLTIDYDSIVMLEDDLVVDRFFYRYICAAATHYQNDHRIAGIALYAYEYNEYTELPFHPVYNGYSTYPMQVTCSWGQCWTAEQWQSFRDWYQDADESTIANQIGIPQAVKKWPKTSWKKFFSTYLVDTKRYFIYPYQAYTTNCATPGGIHIQEGTDVFQNKLGSQNRPSPTFSFCPTEDPDIAYDAFMEPCGTSIYKSLELDKSEVEIDLMRIKSIDLIRQKPYTLTTRQVRKQLKQYPISFRPIENNIIFTSLKLGQQYRISLAKSNDVYKGNLTNRSADEYSYFAGFNINIIKSFLIRLRAMLRNLVN